MEACCITYLDDMLNAVFFKFFTRFLNSQVKDCICRLVQSSVESGARLLLDGRNVRVRIEINQFLL